jgi:hypothetical protein
MRLRRSKFTSFKMVIPWGYVEKIIPENHWLLGKKKLKSDERFKIPSNKNYMTDKRLSGT